MSQLTLGKFGCLTASIATIGSWFKDPLTPKDYASKKNLYTANGLIIWKQIEKISDKIKFKYRYYHFLESVIDEALNNPDTACLLNVDRGYHWVSTLKKVNGGYLCSDPWTFPAKNRKYSFDDIEGFSVIQKQ